MTDLDFLAIHGLAIRKAGNPASVAVLLGADEADVSAALDRAVTAGHVAGANGTFMVAPAGQAWLTEKYQTVFGGLRADGALLHAYERFEKVNGDLLALMTDWQTMPAGDARVSNDHSNPDYDAKIIDALGALHERAERVVGRAAEIVPRLQTHLDRLEAAYDQVLGGAHDYVSGVRIDSYHTVWYELHEDLLRILEKKRQE
ncbi:hypothetical protein [Aeromicrobium wangtongii]|uniref:hypothetical protein n=1 Tax=Aeromicrobium wangtongii TaxID=2969247 RepID=UPI0020177D57|nr:hypothetical protein [Aeromicrobium wangtongii]MCL3818603.1 hypothetical protein [Aeromicrobium wangtongii]